MHYKNIVVANTKGGVGKSTISFHILPYILKDENFKIIEIDNNNNTAKHLENSILKKSFKSVDIKEGTKELEELVVANMIGDDITIIDAGGGDDSKKVIESFIEQNLTKDTLFVIPYMADFVQIANLLFTRKLIEGCDYIVVANNIDLHSDNDLMFVHGNKDFDIPNFSEMFDRFSIIEKTSLFSYAVNKQMLITDLAKDAFDFSQEEILEYAKEKTGADKEAMLKIYRNWKISKLAKDYLESETIEQFRKEIMQ